LTAYQDSGDQQPDPRGFRQNTSPCAILALNGISRELLP
jgi:hypothetical protein